MELLQPFERNLLNVRLVVDRKVISEGMFVFLATRDIVRDVQIVAGAEEIDHSGTAARALHYHISWAEPFEPNGLIYFYVIYIAQDRANGPKEERCVGNDVHSINVTLIPGTPYRVRIITYTIARLNNEYGAHEQISEDYYAMNATNLFFEYAFRSKELASKWKKKIVVE